MKPVKSLALLSGSVLISLSAISLANDHDGGQGIQTAIHQHETNIQRFKDQHPDKAIPKGLIHSRDILEKIQLGERPDITRPERPELPDVSMRPALPDLAMRPARPETPNRPDKPNNGRH